MEKNQAHSGIGDNVYRDKIENKSYASNTNDVHSNVFSKIENIKNAQNLDFEDNDVIIVLKEVVRELIAEEQRKTHNMVRIGTIREKFKSLFDDDTFKMLIKSLIAEGTIEFEEAQVCFTSTRTNFKLNL